MSAHFRRRTEFLNQAVGDHAIGRDKQGVCLSVLRPILPPMSLSLRILALCLSLAGIFAADRLTITIPTIEGAGSAWPKKLDSTFAVIVDDNLAVGIGNKEIKGLGRNGSSWSVRLPDGYFKGLLVGPWQGGVVLPLRRSSSKVDGTAIAMVIAADGISKLIDGGAVDVNDQIMERTAWIEAEGAARRLVVGAQVRRKTATGTIGVVQTVVVAPDGTTSAVQEAPLPRIEHWTDPHAPRRLQPTDHAVLFQPPATGIPAILGGTPAIASGAPPSFPRLSVGPLTVDAPLPAISAASGEILVGWSDADRPRLRQVCLMPDAERKIPIPGMVIQDDDIDRSARSWWSPGAGIMVVWWKAKHPNIWVIATIDPTLDAPIMKPIVLADDPANRVIGVNRGTDGAASLTVWIAKGLRTIPMP